jgi:predicted DNA-binding transcriptional regulator AlpA
MVNHLEKIAMQLDIIIDLLKQTMDEKQCINLANSRLCLNANTSCAAADAQSGVPLLDVQDVMERLGISESTYYRFVRNGELRPRKKGRRHYYHPSDLDAQLKQSVRKGRI